MAITRLEPLPSKSNLKIDKALMRCLGRHDEARAAYVRARDLTEPTWWASAAGCG